MSGPSAHNPVTNERGGGNKTWRHVLSCQKYWLTFNLWQCLTNSHTARLHLCTVALCFHMTPQLTRSLTRLPQTLYAGNTIMARPWSGLHIHTQSMGEMFALCLIQPALSPLQTTIPSCWCQGWRRVWQNCDASIYTELSSAMYLTEAVVWSRTGWLGKFTSWNALGWRPAYE